MEAEGGGAAQQRGWGEVMHEGHRQDEEVHDDEERDEEEWMDLQEEEQEEPVQGARRAAPAMTQEDL